jgi:anti-anti-sigma regulatory factor
MEITVMPGKGRGKRKSRKMAINGAMTIYSVAAAKYQLLDGLDGVAELEIDLSEVIEMDTAGAQLLVLLKQQSVSAGKRLVLSRHSAAVLEAFDCYQLAAFFGDPIVISKGKA